MARGSRNFRKFAEFIVSSGAGAYDAGITVAFVGLTRYPDMTKHFISLSLVALAAALVVPCAQAQMRGGFGSGSAGRGAPGGRGGHGFGHHRGSFFGADYWPFDDGYFDESDQTDQSSPQVVVLQSSAQAPPAPARVPADPLIIELQGDHWVRLTDYGEESQTNSRTTQDARDSLNFVPASARAANNPAARQTAPETPAAPLPLAILVFRDGHQEEIGKYLIEGTTIYTGADYWTTGSWTRKVPIADLNVAETLKLNQQRGANFRLPSNPNEVMLRP